MEDLDIGLLKDLTKIGIDPTLHVITKDLTGVTLNSDVEFAEKTFPKYRSFDGCWITHVHLHGNNYYATHRNQFLTKAALDAKVRWGKGHLNVYLGYRTTIFTFSNGKRARLEMLYPDEGHSDRLGYSWVYPCTLKILVGKSNRIAMKMDSLGANIKYSKELHYYEMCLNALEHFGLNLGTNNRGEIKMCRCLYTSDKDVRTGGYLFFPDKATRMNKRFTL